MSSKNTVLALTLYIPFHLTDLSQVYGLVTEFGRLGRLERENVSSCCIEGHW